MTEFDQQALQYRTSKEIQFQNYLVKVRQNFKCEKISYFIKGYDFIDGYIYYPQSIKAGEKFQTIINLHGGGNVLGQFELDDKYCQLIADQTGRAVVNIDYLLAPEHKFPKPIISTYKFIELLIADADKYNLITDELVLMGHSAGGYISTCLAVYNQTYKKINISQIVANYAPIIQDNFESFEGSENSFVDRVAQYRMWYFESEQDCSSQLATPINGNVDFMPEMLIISAGNDILQHEELQFAKKLKKSGCSIVHKLFDGCDHGFTHEAFNEYNPRQSAVAWTDIVNFILGKPELIEGVTEL